MQGSRVFGCGQPPLRYRDTCTLFSHCFRCVLCLDVRALLQSRALRAASKRPKHQIRASQGGPDRAFRTRIPGLQGTMQGALEGNSGERDSVSNGSKLLRTCVAGRAQEAARAAGKLGRVCTDRSQGSNNAFKEVRKGLQRQTSRARLHFARFEATLAQEHVCTRCEVILRHYNRLL